MSPNKNNSELSVHSPAKINLLLAIHGRRPDGFHELTSLVAALDFGDELTVGFSDHADQLSCSDPAVPSGTENLVLQAAEAFRRRLGRMVHFKFDLEKRIPMGAGLGGGSGNAAAALRAMNQLLGEPLSMQTLQEIAAELGSDCSFFIEGKPAWMSGRGETIEPLDTSLAEQLRGTPVVLFKPDFAINTAWAYGFLATRTPQAYQPEAVDKKHVEDSIQRGESGRILLNTLETPVGHKYLALPTLLEQLRDVEVSCLMSGSGSCCFALPRDSHRSVAQIRNVVQDAWDKSVFWVETFIC